MTVSSTSSRVVYNGNGSTTIFPFGFKVQQPADLAVVYTDATGTDFTLSASQYGATGFGVDAGGMVTYPLSGSAIASGTALTIYRKVVVTQPTSISNQGAMWPQVIEAALDRLTYIAQNVSDTVSRALVISPTDSGSLSALPNRTQRANSVLGFDGAGQPYAAQLVAGLGAASAWLVTNFFPMSSAASARGALGEIAAGDNTAFTGTNSFPTPSAGDNSTKAATTAYADRSASNATAAYVIRSYLAGLGLSNDATTPNTRINVAAGICADDTNALMLTLSAGTIDCTTVGANGLDAGVLANSTWYSVFAIGRTNGTTALLASTSATAPVLPSGYTLKRRIGFFRTDGSARILAFVQLGDKFLWKSPPTDASATSIGTSQSLIALSVPAGTIVEALLRVMGSGYATYAIYSPNQNAETVGPQAAPTNLVAVNGASGNSAAANYRIFTNAASQIAAVCNTTGAITVATDGWIDRRGRDL